MSCIKVDNGFVCVGNEPEVIEHNGKTYYFEFHKFGGPIPCTKDGDQRLSPVPKAVWEKLDGHMKAKKL